MNDQEILDRSERAAASVIGSNDAYEALLRRRDRKRRNQRITAGVLGIAVFVAAVWFVRDVTSLGSDTSVVPAVSGATGPAETGPAETGPAETGPAETDPAETDPAETDPAETVVGYREMDNLLDLETGETTPLPEEIRGDWFNGYAVSPDGSEVAYYRWAGLVEGPPLGPSPGEDGTQALFVARIDGTHVRQIADDALVGGGASSDTGPAWSPDGTKIAYTALPSGVRTRPNDGWSGHTGNINVFVVDLASGVSTQVTFETVDVSGTAFSPDGSSIVYTADLPGGSEVRIAPATGGEGSTLVGGHGSSASGASFSPDGSLLSYSCNEPDADAPFSMDLCLANADGSDPRVIARAETPNGMGGVVTATWSPDGSRLAFWTLYGEEGVYILDLATGQTTCVAGCEIGAWPIPAWPRWLDDHTVFVEAYHGPH